MNTCKGVGKRDDHGSDGRLTARPGVTPRALVRSRRPVAILDWSNALTGEPALDLARVAEYGSLTPAALAVYGPIAAFSLTPRTPREIIYRLDTAVMLSHVFLDGAPDEDKARHYIERTRTLCRALSGG